MEAKRIKKLLVDMLDNGKNVDPDVDIQTMFKPKPASMKERIRQD